MAAGLHRLWVCIFPTFQTRLRRSKLRGSTSNEEVHVVATSRVHGGTEIQRDYVQLFHSLVTMLIPTSSCSLPHSSEIIVLATGDTPDNKPISKLQEAWIEERNDAEHTLFTIPLRPSPCIILVTNPTILSQHAAAVGNGATYVVHIPGRKRSGKGCIKTKGL